MRAATPGTPSGHPLLVLSLLLLLSGCAAGQVTSVGSFQSLDPPLKTIALAPNGGIFADLIGIELSGQGYTIIDSGSTLALLLLMQQNANDLLNPQLLSILKQRGIDAVMVVQKVDGKDGLPQTIHLRLHSTDRLTEIGGIDWENSWIRRGVLEAAQEVASGMVKDSPASDHFIGDEQSIASPP
jgi:hypothetical protein